MHASDPFNPSDTDQLIHRLAYAYRTPVALSNLSYSKETVYLRTKKGALLKFSPLDFIAKLTLHIPDTYQHMRRLSGLYASKTRLFLGLKTMAQAKINIDRKLSVSWASLISKIFGQIPTLCPHCYTEMKLIGSLFDGKVILQLIPNLARAPPVQAFETYLNRHAGKPFLQAAEEITAYKADELAQASPDLDADFDQRHPDESLPSLKKPLRSLGIDLLERIGIEIPVEDLKRMNATPKKPQSSFPIRSIPSLFCAFMIALIYESS